MISKSQFIIFSAFLATAGAPGSDRADENDNDDFYDKFSGPLGCGCGGDAFTIWSNSQPARRGIFEGRGHVLSGDSTSSPSEETTRADEFVVPNVRQPEATITEQPPSADYDAQTNRHHLRGTESTAEPAVNGIDGREPSVDARAVQRARMAAAAEARLAKMNTQGEKSSGR